MHDSKVTTVPLHYVARLMSASKVGPYLRKRPGLERALRRLCSQRHDPVHTYKLFA